MKNHGQACSSRAPDGGAPESRDPELLWSGNMRLMLNVILITILVTPCYAFEPKKHEIFSNHAVSIYETCTGRAMPKEVSSAFVRGSVNEDEWGRTRLKNWHFYNRDKRIGRYWKFIFYCYGSNEHVFCQRLNTLDGLFVSKAPIMEIYEVAGRIAHHIQDMSSPPHVMPIYHTSGDKFDTHKPMHEPVVDVAAICKEVNGPVVEPFKLLDDAAKNTLKAVVEKDVFADGETGINDTWMKFWGGPDDQDLSGFKTYGDYGNLFGTIPPCESILCRAYDSKAFDRFYSDRYIRAVTDTARVLIYLDRRNAGLKQPVMIHDCEKLASDQKQ